jgi:hypothetical protein
MTIRRGLQQVRACRLLQAGVVSLGLASGLALAAAASAAAAAPPLGGTWQPIGPSGGHVSALAVDPLRPATIYAGTVGGGLYRSDDFGRSWSARGLGTWINVNSVTIDPVVPDTLYAGVDDSAHANGALWKSLDGGSSWQVAGAGLPTGDGGVSALAIDPLTPSTLYAESPGALWKSVDGAHSWAALPLTLSNTFARALAIDPLRPAVLYAASDTGLFKSSDGGATWAPAIRLRNLVVTSVAVDPVLPRRVYVGALQDVASNGTPSNRPTLFLSTDRGGTWHPANGGLSPQGPCSRCPGSDWGKQSVWSLAVSPAAHLTVYAGTFDGVWKSTNGGGSWAPANAGLARVFVGELAADPTTSGRLYAGVGVLFSNEVSGVWKTANGGAAWRSASAGIDSSDVATLVVGPSGTGILYAAVPGSGVLKRQGGNWQPANQGLMGTQVSALVIDPQQSQTLYAKTEGGFWKTADGAASWSQPSPGTAVAAPPLLIDPQTPTTLYAMGALTGPGHSINFQKSVDGGVTWSLLPVGGPTGEAALAPSAPLNLYWVSSITIYHTSSSIAHSPDGGLSIDGHGEGFASLGPFVVDPQDPATVYAFANVGPIFPVSYDSVALVKSTDSGHTFMELNCRCQPLVFAPGPPQTLYAAAGDAIVASSDGGASWTSVGDPLPAGAQIASMAFDPSSQTLFVATNNRGVYQLMP